MTELGSPYPEAHVTAGQLRPRVHAVIWLVTTLSFSLLPFAILPLIYHAFHKPHEWPGAYSLFGHGDLALVVVAVLGATVAELVSPSRMSDAVRAVMVALSAVCGMTAVTVYSISQYQALAREGADIEVNTFVLAALLGTTVTIQCLLILKRQLSGKQ